MWENYPYKTLQAARFEGDLKSTAERRKYFPTIAGLKQVYGEVYCGETKVLPNGDVRSMTCMGSLLRRDESTSQLHQIK